MSFCYSGLRTDALIWSHSTSLTRRHVREKQEHVCIYSHTKNTMLTQLASSSPTEIATQLTHTPQLLAVWKTRSRSFCQGSIYPEVGFFFSHFHVVILLATDDLQVLHLQSFMSVLCIIIRRYDDTVLTTLRTIFN